MEIKNLKKAAQRILKAIKNREKIILYGDADLDGVSSVIILKECIRNLAGNVVAVYFPDREIEGYGISETGLSFLKKYSSVLLVAVDCGIGNFKEVIMAKKLGFKVIIIDHHEILDKLPKAEIIVNPKQKGDLYPFKVFSTAGIVFKLSELLLNPVREKSSNGVKNKMTEILRRNFLELVALATIADMMPKENENKIFIEEGLASLKNSWRPTIQVFFAPNQIWWQDKNYDFFQKVSKFISILNVRDVNNNFPASFRLLTSPSSKECKKLIEQLLEKRELGRQKIEEIIEEIEARLWGKEQEPIIFEGDPRWEVILISSVASLLCQQYKKPIFIYKKLKTESQGTVRAPSGTDSVALMKKCSKYPLTYGGHPPASGFRIKNENLERFKECLIKNHTT